jgi:membrane protein insertase Oxa1/YidC/SpoIIIJ
MFGTIYSNNLNNVIVSTEISLQKNANNLQARAILLPIYQQTAKFTAQAKALKPQIQAINAAIDNINQLGTALTAAAKVIDDIVAALGVVANL